MSAAPGAATGGAVAAAIANAIKASGAIVRVEPADFVNILRRQEAPLVIHAPGGIFGSSHRYLCSYKGLAFFAKSPEPLRLPAGSEVIEARKIWIPG
jgi:hypothetical protein